MPKKSMITVLAIMLVCVVSSMALSITLGSVVGPRVSAATELFEFNNRNYFTYATDNPSLVTGLSEAGVSAMKSAASGVASVHLTFPEGITGVTGRSTGEARPGEGGNVVPGESFLVGPDYDFTNYLKVVTMPHNMRTIGEHAFRRCSYLAEINLPETQVTTIGDFAFADINFEYFASVQFPATLATIGNSAFCGRFLGSVETIDLSKTQVTTIGERAFYHDPVFKPGAKTIKFPATLTSIGSSAFRGHTALQEVDLSNTQVTTLGDHAFNCQEYTSVKLPATLTTIGNFALAGAYRELDLAHTAVTSIGKQSFSPKLVSIELPTTLSSMEDSAFYNCKSLTEIDLSQTKVTQIKELAFYDCTALTSVKLPAGVESIGRAAFSGNESLDEINLPNTLSSLGARAFYGCKSLTSLDLSQTQLSRIEDNTFQNCTALANLQLPNGVESLGQAAMSNCSSLTSLDLSATNLTEIEDNTFQSCTALTKVKLPNGVEGIGEYAFSKCEALTEFNFSAVLTEIGRNAFTDCKSLVSADLSQTQVTEIPESVFQGCSALTSVKFPQSLCELGESVVSGCLNLQSIDLSHTAITELGESVFMGCDGLTKFKFPAGLQAIGDSALMMTGLTSVALPKGVQRIGMGAFFETPLKEIYLPASITEIGMYAFGSFNYDAMEEEDYEHAYDVSKTLKKIVIGDEKFKTNSAEYGLAEYADMMVLGTADDLDESDHPGTDTPTQPGDDNDDQMMQSDDSGVVVAIAGSVGGVVGLGTIGTIIGVVISNKRKLK